jgi:hypothetical protein
MVRVRSVMLALVALLYIAGWPGSVVRPVVFELTAPELPQDLEGRDGVLEVAVRLAEEDAPGAPAAGATVRAFAILDGRAHAAAQAVTDAEGYATLDRLPPAEHWSSSRPTSSPYG